MLFRSEHLEEKKRKQKSQQYHPRGRRRAGRRKSPPPRCSRVFLDIIFLICLAVFSPLSHIWDRIVVPRPYRAARWNRAHAYPPYCCISSSLNLSKFPSLWLSDDIPRRGITLIRLLHTVLIGSTNPQTGFPSPPPLLLLPRYLTKQLPHC